MNWRPPLTKDCIMKIGFIGLGRMGAGMAANLLSAGHEVVVYNRTRSKADELVAKGAGFAQTIADAASGEAVVTMLSDDKAVESVVFGAGGVLETLAPGALHVSSSTISVALAERLAREHDAAGAAFVSAPVFGRPDAAAAGQLFIAAAGAEAALSRAKPIFDAIAKQSFILSKEPHHANLVKISGNFLIACVIESVGEALALVGKGGVDQSAFVDFLTATLFNAPVYKTYGGLIAERKFSPAGFAAPLGLKDVGLALAASQELRAPMPIASLLRDRFLTLLANEGEDLDWSAVGALAAKDAGLDA
jgi:3-hydroxyisobutyrate dehydrogenase-like beta-hydroxyacid dehydrogenase